MIVSYAFASPAALAGLPYDPADAALRSAMRMATTAVEDVAGVTFVEVADAELLELVDPSGFERDVWQLRHRPAQGAHTYDITLVVDEIRNRYELVVTEGLNDPRPDVITVVPMYRAWEAVEGASPG